MLQGFIFTGLLLVFIGLMVKKHPNILAGYNTMSGEMKKKIDIEKVSTTSPLFVFGVLGLLLTLITYKKMKNQNL